MLTVEQIKAGLKDMNLRAVAKSCGLHENTVYSFMRSDDPRTRTAEKLSDYLEGKTRLTTKEI